MSEGNLFSHTLALKSRHWSVAVCYLSPCLNKQRPFNYKGWSFKAINSTARAEICTLMSHAQTYACSDMRAPVWTILKNTYYH